MDEATLRRLAEDGLIGHPPDLQRGLAPRDLPELAEWCNSHGEYTDKVAFTIVGAAVALAGTLREDDEQGIPGPFAREVDGAIRSHLPGILNEQDREAQLHLARAFREQIQLIIGNWSGWETWWLHSPPTESS